MMSLNITHSQTCVLHLYITSTASTMVIPSKLVVRDDSMPMSACHLRSCRSGTKFVCSNMDIMIAPLLSHRRHWTHILWNQTGQKAAMTLHSSISMRSGLKGLSSSFSVPHVSQSVLLEGHTVCEIHLIFQPILLWGQRTTWWSDTVPHVCHTVWPTNKGSSHWHVQSKACNLVWRCHHGGRFPTRPALSISSHCPKIRSNGWCMTHVQNVLVVFYIFFSQSFFQ